MDDMDVTAKSPHGHAPFGQVIAPPFIAAEVLMQVNLLEARGKLAQIIETEIVPRLVSLRLGNQRATFGERDGPAQDQIITLARLVLQLDIKLSSDFVQDLRDSGLSSESLFVDLLEPAARYLGTMWDNDECDFVEVTLGVGRLQQLLSLFNCSFEIPAFSEKRRVCMMSLADEQHSFGVAMIEKFLWAGGWLVASEREAKPHHVSRLMRTKWYAVVELTASSDRHLDSMAAVIREIRRHSRNPSIGIMVGGPPFTRSPELAATVGADATAINAPTAVVLAQKLFDVGARTNWHGSYERA